MGHITAHLAATLPPSQASLLGAPLHAPQVSGGAVLLRVLEAAQRMVAYCDNAAVGATDDPALELIGIPAPRLDRALRDLVQSVHDMNMAMTGEAACAALAALHRVPAGPSANRPLRARRAVNESVA